MSTKRTLLVQLDTDPQPSLFDRIVALDAGAEEVLSYSQVTVAQVQSLVHGAIFTRGPKDLQRTALYFGGSQVPLAEQLFADARKHLIPQFGLSVSMMLDPNGSSTTAAAAVRCASRHLTLANTSAMVLGAGPVGQRAARLLASLNATVTLADVDGKRLEEATASILLRHPHASITPFPVDASTTHLHHACQPSLLIAAGPAGKVVFPKRYLEDSYEAFANLKVMIDLNAVPPSGIEGVDVMDAGQSRNGIACYGALGVGNLKMKIHKAAIASLFTSNTYRLDIEEIFELSATL